MLFLRSWLQQYITLDNYTDAQIAECITLGSSEVEEVIRIKDYFEAKVLVGRIQNVQPHPDADKLKVFEVDLGSKGKCQIVSAAANVAEGLIVPCALSGAKLPGLTIAPRKMRGVESQGMCTGQSELMLETEHSHGLWELNLDLQAKGGQISDYLGLSVCEVFPELFPQDTIFDIKVLPNKIGEIGSHLGMALDLAKILQRPDLLTQAGLQAWDPQLLAQTLQELQLPKDDTLSASFADPTGYVNSFVLLQVKLAGTYHLPHLWRQRMFLSRRNLVDSPADLSNYLLADIGQPTHFFSAAKTLGQDTQNLDWRAEKLETPVEFHGLGQLKQTVLTPGIVVLKQDSPVKIEPLSVLAIAGSENTKVDHNDRDILVEIANFPAQDVSRATFDLKYRSDASRIWAGGVNQALTVLTLVRLLQALPEQTQTSFLYAYSTAGGLSLDWEAAKQILLNWLDPSGMPVVKPDMDFLAQRLDGRSAEEWREQIHSSLSLLGNLTEDGLFYQNPFYGHLGTQEDLFEDLVRLIGFKALNSASLSLSTDRRLDTTFADHMALRRICTAYGLDEIITRPFVSEDHTISFLSGQTLANQPLETIKPYSSQEPFVRDALLPGLLSAVSKNLLKGEKQTSVFELNHVHSYKDQLQEVLSLEAIITSDDPYVATSLVRALIKATGNYQSARSEDLKGVYTGLGQGVTYTFAGQSIHLLQLKNSLKKQFALPINKIFWYLAFELPKQLSLNTYPDFRDESNFPWLTRSYSLQVPKNLSWGDISKTLADTVLDQDIQLQITPLERRSLNSDQDSLTYQVKMVSYRRTLETVSIDTWHQTCLQRLQVYGQISER